MNPHHYAVVVGIDKYPAFSHLNAAQRDAADFYTWVTDSAGGGVATSSAKLIPAVAAKSRLTARPTCDEIFEALENAIDSLSLSFDRDPGTWKESRLYLFVAGHGIAPKARDAALLAANADKRHINEHISAESLLEYFSRVQHFRELVIFADCCRTRTDRATQSAAPWTDDDIRRGNVRKFFAVGADFMNKSYEEIEGPPEERRGYFTRALLDGLRGGAEKTARGQIGSTALKTYIEGHMQRNSEKRFLKPLQPDFIDEGRGGDVLFGPPLSVATARAAAAEAPRRYPVQLKIDMPELAAVEIVGPENTAAIRSNGTFHCELPVGIYEAVPVTGTPPSRQPRNWFFKVTEGANEYAF